MALGRSVDFGRKSRGCHGDAWLGACVSRCRGLPGPGRRLGFPRRQGRAGYAVEKLGFDPQVLGPEIDQVGGNGGRGFIEIA